MKGYDYRARMITDANGAFEFETIRPRGYSGLGAHIHFVITHPGYRTLNTELRFSDGRADSARDGFPPELVTELVERRVHGQLYEEGTFEVVLASEK
jgi:protocatechuate 3,4-dioxygenase beta subunit